MKRVTWFHDPGYATLTGLRWAGSDRRIVAAAMMAVVWCSVAGCPTPRNEGTYPAVDSPEVGQQGEPPQQEQLAHEEPPVTEAPSDGLSVPPTQKEPETEDPPSVVGSSADCLVTTETTPSFMPASSLSRASDLILTVGDDLNGFWDVDACVFAADAVQVPEIQGNAFAVNSPPTVAYDPMFFDDLVNRWGNETPVLVVIAHEWGHEVQYAYNLFPPDAYTFDLEQDADWRAGYYLGSVALTEGVTNFGEISQVLAEFACSLGDPEGYPWYASGAHGSCEQRAQAIVAGFDEAVNSSSLGREPRTSPGSPAPMAGTWEGPLTLYVTVVQDEQPVAPTESIAGDYWFTAGEDGRIVDDFGTGPVPDVGQERAYPFQSGDLALDMHWTNEATSFDDDAIRYDWSVIIPQGVLSGSTPVSGYGFATDVFVFESQNQLRYYSYVSLTLVTFDCSTQATVVIESLADMTRR